MINIQSLLMISLAACVSARAQPAQRPEIPSVLSSLSYNADGKLVLEKNGQQLVDLEKKDPYTLDQMLGDAVGKEGGIELNFHNSSLSGTVAYGPYDEHAEYPTVAFLAKSAKLQKGVALLEFKTTFTASNDFFKLKDKGKGIIGYRVSDADGRILYEGRIAFEGTGPYRVLPSIVEGPFVNELSSSGCTLSFETQTPIIAKVDVGGKTFADETASKHHEIKIRTVPQRKRAVGK